MSYYIQSLSRGGGSEKEVDTSCELTCWPLALFLINPSVHEPLAIRPRPHRPSPSPIPRFVIPTLYFSGLLSSCGSCSWILHKIRVWLDLAIRTGFNDRGGVLFLFADTHNAQGDIFCLPS